MCFIPFNDVIKGFKYVYSTHAMRQVVNAIDSDKFMFVTHDLI